MPTLPELLPYAVPFFVVFTFVEMALWRSGRARVRYETRDAAASLAMGVGNLVVGVTLGFIAAGAMAAVYPYRLFDIGYAGWAFAACFLLEDLSYYGFHRASHRLRWFWADHVAHHSSRHYNLTTALRQTWTNPIAFGFAFWLPMTWIGFEPAMVAFFKGVSMIYQFWIHTEAIGRLGPLEAVFNTPSHHRVHHATNPRYLDANFAGVLIVWDRLFGTFVAERDDDPPRYGITRNLGTFNPLRIAFHEWQALGSDLSRARSVREAYRYVLGPPGWSPDGSRRTTDEIRAAWRREQEKAAKA